MAVIAVETRRPGAPDELILADSLQPVSVSSGYRPIHELIEHLRVAGRILVIHGELCGRATNGFRDAVAAAIVDINDRARISSLSSKS